MIPSAKGQGIIPRSPSQLDAPDASRQIEAEQQKETLDPKSPSYLPPYSFLQWGPVTARPHLNTSFTYGNSLRSRAGSNANTVVEQISPGSLFELGKKWQLDYTPTLSFYSSKEFKDTLAHNVLFAGGTAYGNWAFTLSQSYSVSSQPLIETGVQTDQESFNTALGASYYFNSKLMLELGLNQSFRTAEAFTSSRDWSTMDWLNYQISNRLSVGAGVGGGYESVSPGPDMTFEQFQAKVNMRIARKLDLDIHGGGEVRQILISGAQDLVNPIYGASVQYHPFEYTTLSLSGNRAVNASLLQGQISESTSISLALNQRLLGLLYLTLSGGFANNRYISSTPGLALNREDDTTSFAASLAYAFTQRGSISIFYNFSDNSSSSGAFDYSSNQVGLQLGYRF
jgi:uncharacterized protein (PEP-CTERM system associated)